MKGFRKVVPMALLKKQFGQEVYGRSHAGKHCGAMQEHFESRRIARVQLDVQNGERKEEATTRGHHDYEALDRDSPSRLSSISAGTMVVKAETVPSMKRWHLARPLRLLSREKRQVASRRWPDQIHLISSEVGRSL